MPDIQPDPATWKWLVQLAAEHHGGDVTAAACAVLTAARLQETNPDLWAALAHKASARGWPPYRIPVRYLVEFIDAWNTDRDGGTARRRPAGA